jgi:hypothetical protein
VATIGEGHTVEEVEYVIHGPVSWSGGCPGL